MPYPSFHFSLGVGDGDVSLSSGGTEPSRSSSNAPGDLPWRRRRKAIDKAFQCANAPMLELERIWLPLEV